jgi:tetratricopeptide (TPR) repeat protein
MKNPNGLVPALFGTAVVALVQAQPSFAAMTATQVYGIAKQVTVRVVGSRTASGVIVGRRGNTYTVITGFDAAIIFGTSEIITPDGQKYRISRSSLLVNDNPLYFDGARYRFSSSFRLLRSRRQVRLAMVEFTSTTNYQVAQLGDANKTVVASDVYVAGFPNKNSRAISDNFTLTSGQIKYTYVTSWLSNPTPTVDRLLYNNITQPGMYGGPVLNDNGEVIGIHLQENLRSDNQFGLNEAMPINIYLAWADKYQAVPLSEVMAATIARLWKQAEAKRHQKEYQGAIASYSEIIRLDPNNINAFEARGNTRFDLTDYLGAFADYDRVIRLYYPDQFYTEYSMSRNYKNRGNARFALKDFQGAIVDYSESIRLGGGYYSSDAYHRRGNVKFELGRLQEAIEDYTQAINKNSLETGLMPRIYYDRGNAYVTLRDLDKAEADYKKAIELAQQHKNKEHRPAGPVSTQQAERIAAATPVLSASVFTYRMGLQIIHSRIFQSTGMGCRQHHGWGDPSFEGFLPAGGA